MKVTRTCLNCGKTIKNTKKFCCKECQKEYYDNRKPNAVCHTCGKSFYQKVKKNWKYSFCCMKCYSAFKKTEEYSKMLSEAKHNMSDEDKKKAKEKYENTMLQRHGVKHNWSSKDPKLNGRAKTVELYGGSGGSSKKLLEKMQQTKFERYGDKNYCNSKKCSETWNNKSQEEKDKITQARKDGIFKKYKVYSYPETDEFKAIFKDKERDSKRMAKIYKTKKENGTMTYGSYVKAKECLDGTKVRSNAEVEIYNCFLSAGIAVEYEHVDDRYPYLCDFYLPTYDIFIEYQGFMSHGKSGDVILGPYDEKREDHRQLLEEWKSHEDDPFFESCIEVWTVTDPEKRIYAEKNNLNWYEFWTLEEFYIWFDSFLEQVC